MAEARLLELAGKGLSLRAIALQVGLSHEAVRQQLTRIHSNTGVAHRDRNNYSMS